jgi:hypothetical protein
MPAKQLRCIAAAVLCLLLAMSLGCQRTDARPVHVEKPAVNAQADTASRATETLRKAAEFLWQSQGADGGWHSETYGLLKSGQALTPFILHALLSVPEEVSTPPEDGVERALAFIREHVDQRGVIGAADPEILEYPNYSTAYALRCLLQAGDASDRELIERMKSYLAAEQFDGDRGFDESSPAFGGWGFGGVHPRGKTGHMDLAHTRRVMQALRQAGLPDSEVCVQAQRFLSVVQKHPSVGVPPSGGVAEASRRSRLKAGLQHEASQRNYDGGFFFSPVVMNANKGRIDNETDQFRSYATATCDGILALLSAEVSISDERVQSAMSWLEEHPRWDYPAGIPTEHPEPWGDAVFFYHLAVRSEVYDALDWDGPWQAEVTKILADDQEKDGSFTNKRSHLMKEDDPFLCTALGVIALGGASR